MDLFGDTIPEDDIEEESELSSSPVPEELALSPRTMTFCKGHDDIEKNLLDLYLLNRLPHGFVFAGPKGIGKSTLAFRFARFLLKQGIRNTDQGGLFGDTPDPRSFDVRSDDPVFRRIASGAHGDLFTVERQMDDAKGRRKNAVDIDEIRKVAPFLRMTSSEGGWRVVIIDDADTMTRGAQNALLKILEEPPKNSILILIAHRAGALIPTIRSRTRFINFQPLQNDSIKNLLEKLNHDLTTSEMRMLGTLASGSPGMAIQYAEEGALKTWDFLLQAFEGYPDWKWLEIHKLSEKLSGPGSDQLYQAFQDVMLWTFSSMARAKARGTDLPEMIEKNPEMVSFLEKSSLEQIMKICENLQNHFSRANFANLDRRRAILGAFSLIN